MEVFFARQPIFDKQQNLYAYDLLFRYKFKNLYESPDWDQATSTAIVVSFLLNSMDTITRGKRAFMSFSPNMLAQGLVTLFPKELVAVEISENVEPDKEIIAACKNLKGLGYLLVLDDFFLKPQCNPLIELADIIKIDFINTNIEEKRSLISKVGSQNIKFLAEKVDTREAFNQALEQGYSYFQGYFFSKPSKGSSHDVPFIKLNYLLVLQEINRPEVDFNRLEKIFKRDVSLSYKLLTHINSAYFGFSNEIRSIKYALSLLGILEVKKWVSLIALNEMGKDKPHELVVISIVRAHFCELIAPKVGLSDRASELFLMGLFSMLDAFLDQPMADILTKLPFSKDIKNALLGEKCLFLDVFELILSYEKGDWEQFSEYAAKLKLVGSEVPVLFLKAIEQSYQIFSP